MTTNAVVLIAILCSVSVVSGLNRLNVTDGFMGQRIDECTQQGQLRIRDQIKSLMQKPVATSKNPWPFTPGQWPADPLEDGDMLKGMPEEQRWKTVGLIKAFNPIFFVPQLAKEIRDNIMCNFKRMECMSIDDIAYPLESIAGTRGFYAQYDALPEEMKPVFNQFSAELRKRVIEPTMLMLYKSLVEPNKQQVEGLTPKGYPYDTVPSMPSSMEGDWDVNGDYNNVGTANLPDGIDTAISGPAYRSPKSSSYSLLELAEVSRAQCKDRPTELKKILCELDFGMVFLRLGEDMKKNGKEQKLSKEEEDKVLNSLAELDNTFKDLKQETLSECKAQK